MSTSSEQAVADFIAGCRWSDLPDDVKVKARFCLLDDLAATVAGTQTKVARIADTFAAETWPGRGSTVLRSRRDTSVVGAAFANAVAANGTDIDDCGVFTAGHPGAQLFPTALALAEARSASGASLLSALVVGYEVAFRAGRCMHDRERSPEERGFRACGSWGSVACAATAAHLMQLPHDQTMHALGIAEYHSPDLPMLRDVDHPTMVKHGIGIGAMTGIMSARLAALGFTGVPGILTFDEYADWVGDIGADYLLPRGIMWKDYSCCAWSHPAINALKSISGVAPIPADRVARIVLNVDRYAAQLGGRLPETAEEAQFNLAWPVACFLAYGEVAPEHVLEPHLGNEVVRALARKVEIRASDEFTRLYDLDEAGDPEGMEAADVTVELDDGRVLTSGVQRAPVYGDWPQDKMEAKFRKLVRGLLGDAATEPLIDMVWRLDELDDVRALTAVIRDAWVGGEAAQT
jgi:2-methylcitrate dehydratase PrpD